MKKGFTLVEILIVISFIAIVFLVGLYSLNELTPGLQLSGSARDFATDLRFIQQVSVTEQSDYCIKMFYNLKKYQVMKCDESEIITEKVLPSYISGFSSTVFSGDKIEFNPYGAVKEGGTITLTSSTGNVKTIEVKASGFVKIND